ncbi:glycerol-3-phosphate dehydrogenase/oxidase [Arcobacter sp. LA11]|uniref:glycerol-3-phosphate dehydrogenase/oxidase n=1 Tax=Arcobacter sp. LA11 TaxID=1898176 RepID=UPI0009337E00|nr:FAD-dependent oxidoreductase [Arcobacter sp. LA11]
MKNKNFDIIIIGGGATGSGIALDAASRGLKTLLLEKNDFSEGTSSRSTKLVHGGVRYLEKAVKQLNKDQFNLVKEGLKERSRLLKNAPHLCSKLTLITPIYKWWELPYMFVGLSLYDFVSGTKGLGRSGIISKSKMLKKFPVIKKDGLVGGVKYYDGSFNDSRLTISLLQTARKHGADCRNYNEVIAFKYDDNQKVIGVEVLDKINNEKKLYEGTSIINAAGVFADKVNELDEQKAKKMLDLSSGIHIILDKKYLPSKEGLMIPKTEDGRVLFILPWMGKCLVGTTDDPTTLSAHPEVKENDVEYILRHLEIYFDLKIDKSEILAQWCGIRPLVAPDENADTSSIVREHEIRENKSGLISIIGGKWTTYRKMAEQLVDFVYKSQNMKKEKCRTKKLKLIGSKKLDVNYVSNKVDINTNEYLISQYGDKIDEVLSSVEKIEYLKEGEPYTNAEVIYTINEEFVKKPMDYLVRRCNVALIDKKVSIEILEKVLQIMKIELSWSEEQTIKEKEEALSLLNNSI